MSLEQQSRSSELQFFANSLHVCCHQSTGRVEIEQFFAIRTPRRG